MHGGATPHESFRAVRAVAGGHGRRKLRGEVAGSKSGNSCAQADVELLSRGQLRKTYAALQGRGLKAARLRTGRAHGSGPPPRLKFWARGPFGR